MISSSLFIASLLFTVSLQANIIWPALFVSGAIFSSWFLVIISIIIEGLLFPFFIKNISYAKGLFMSLVGNAFSAGLGTIVMMHAMIGWHFMFDSFLGGTFNTVNFIATWVLMCFGSALIELLALKLIFKYTARQLLAPALIGNIITYALTAVYEFPHDVKNVLNYIFQ